jgi:hypothetical protein
MSWFTRKKRAPEKPQATIAERNAERRKLLEGDKKPEGNREKRGESK